MGDRNTRRIVVTGRGRVTPRGTGVEKTGKALGAGEAGIGRRGTTPSHGAETPHAANPRIVLEPRNLRRLHIA